MKIKAPSSLQDFDRYYRLRWEILRKPWGQPKGSEKLNNEDACVHAMAYTDEENITGVAMLQFNTPSIAQIRFVAVDSIVQGKGIGRKLMLHLEDIAKQQGATEVVLDARENAVVFYKSLGYELIEKAYLLFNEIQHYRMRKYL